MSQNDLSIANQGFASFRSDLNSALQALGSTNSGTSAPSTTYATQLFYDTTNNILKIRNEDNDAFISLFTLDQSNDNIESLTINGALSAESLDLNGGELILDADNDTSITSDTDDRVDIKVAGSDVVHVNSSGIGIKTTSGSSFTQNASSDLVIGAGSGNSGMTLFSGTSSQGAISFADGTASDNTQYRGFINYAHNLDALLFGVSGAEKVRIDASGRLLLGTSTSFADGNSEDLQISSSGDTGIMIKSGTSNFGSIHFGDATSGSARNRGVVRYNHTDDALELFTAESQRVTIDSSGRVGIDATPTAQFNHSIIQLGGQATFGANKSLSTTGQTYFTHNLYYNTDGNLRVYNTSGANEGAIQQMSEGNFIFSNSSATTGTPTVTERLKIGSNGHLFATNSDTSLSNLTLKKSAGDSIDYLQCRKTDNDLRIVLEGSGDVHNATGTFSAISDEKLKENIVDASSQWDDIKNIKIRNFSLKADKSSEANMIGVVAQEIEKVSPNLVKERTDRNPDTGEDLGTKTKIVKYSILHTKAVKALQEAMARIEALEAKVTALESK